MFKTIGTVIRLCQVPIPAPVIASIPTSRISTPRFRARFPSSTGVASRPPSPLHWRSAARSSRRLVYLECCSGAGKTTRECGYAVEITKFSHVFASVWILVSTGSITFTRTCRPAIRSRSISVPSPGRGNWITSSFPGTRMAKRNSARPCKSLSGSFKFK